MEQIVEFDDAMNFGQRNMEQASNFRCLFLGNPAVFSLDSLQCREQATAPMGEVGLNQGSNVAHDYPPVIYRSRFEIRIC